MSWNHLYAKFAGGPPQVNLGTPASPTSFKERMVQLMGQPKFDFNLDGLSEKNMTSWTLPEALRGENPEMAQRFEMWSILADSFYTKVLLPIKKTNKMKIAMTRWIFLPSLAQPTPERGRVRILENRQTETRRTLERFAIGMELPYAFLTTEYGMKIYETQLMQMRQAVEETNAFGVIHAILSCWDAVKDFEARYKSFRDKSLWDMMEWERFLFGIIQKHETPLEALGGEISKIMRQYGGKADTWLMHEKIMIYVTQVPEMYTRFFLGGERAVRTLKEGKDAFQRDARGNRIYEVRTYDIGLKTPIDILKKYVTYGEYNLAFDTKRGKSSEYKRYASHHRDIAFYDAHKNDWHTVGLKWMKDNCNRIDKKTGKLMSTAHPAVKRYTVSLDDKLKRDSLHYYTKNAKGENVLVACEYFGQILKPYFEVSDIVNLADTALQGMKDISTKYEKGQVVTILTGLTEAVSAIEAIPYNDTVDAYLRFLVEDNLKRPLSTHTGATGLKPLEVIQEMGRNAYGSLDLPVFGELADETRIESSGILLKSRLDGAPLTYKSVDELRAAIAVKDGRRAFPIDFPGEDPVVRVTQQIGGLDRGYIEHPLYPNQAIQFGVGATGSWVRIQPRRVVGRHALGLPPFYANWPGFQTISAAVAAHGHNAESFETRYHLSYEQCRKVHDGVRLLDTIVTYLVKMFPGSVFTNPGYCSSWWHVPSAACNFFDSVVIQHRTPVSLFLGPFGSSARQPTDSQGRNSDYVSAPDRDGVPLPPPPASTSAGAPKGPPPARTAASVSLTYEQVLENIFALSNGAFNYVEAYLIGKTDTLQNVLRNYFTSVIKGLSQNQAADILKTAGVTSPGDVPYVRIGANLSGTTASTSTDNASVRVVFDPRQGRTEGEFIWGDDLAPLYKALPALARLRWTASFNPEVTAAGAAPEALFVTDTANGGLRLPAIGDKRFAAVDISKKTVPPALDEKVATSVQKADRKAQNDKFDDIVKEVDFLYKLRHNAKQTFPDEEITEEKIRTVADLELKRALLAAPFSYLQVSDILQNRIGGDQEALNLDDAHRLARRIRAVREGIMPVIAVQLQANGRIGNDVLASVNPDIFLRNFISFCKNKIQSSMHPSTPGSPHEDNPLRLQTEEQVMGAVDTLRRIITQGAQSVANAKNWLRTGAGKTNERGSDAQIPVDKTDREAYVSARGFRHNLNAYARAPLTYSPSQLVSHYEYLVNKSGDVRRIPMALPNDPVFPEQKMRVDQEKTYSDQVVRFLSTGDPELLKQLHPTLRSFSSNLLMPVHTSSAIAGVQRVADYIAGRLGGAHRKRKNITGDDYQTIGGPIEGEGKGSYIPGASKGTEDSLIDELESIASTGATQVAMDINTLNALNEAEGRLHPKLSSRIGGVRAAAVFGEDLGRSAIDAAYRKVTSSAFGIGSQGAKQVPFYEQQAKKSVRDDLQSLDQIDMKISEKLVTHNFQLIWRELEMNQTDILNTWIAKVYMGTPIEDRQLEAFIRNDILFPFNFLIFRPFIKFGTYPIIYMLAGEQTGKTWVGNSIFAWGDDQQTHVYRANYAYYAGSEVLVKENVFIANNVFIDEYLSGMSCRPWTLENYTAENVNRGQADAFVVLEPYTTDLTKYDNTLSITGRPEAFGRVLHDIKTLNEIDYCNAYYYNMMFGWQSDNIRQQYDEFLQSYSYSEASMNKAVHRGGTLYYVPNDNGGGGMRGVCEAFGFFDTDTYGPGMKQVWEGKMTRYKRHDYSSYVKVA